MGKEIELKFLLENDLEKVQEFIATNTLVKKERIVQTYVVADDEMEIRVRKTEDGFYNKKHFLTFKSGGTLERIEVEKEITKEKFQDLYLASRSDAIVKERYTLSVNGYLYEIDIYSESLEGLAVLEIELDSGIGQIKIDKLKGNLPEFIVKDVTEDKSYKNKNLWKKINTK